MTPAPIVILRLVSESFVEVKIATKGTIWFSPKEISSPRIRGVPGTSDNGMGKRYFAVRRS